MTSKNASKMSRRDFMKAAALGGSAAAMARFLPLAAAQETTGSVTYWHHFTSETEFRGMERVIALFRERYPNIELIQENIPNAEFMAKFTQAVQANSRPDTTMIASDRLPDMVAMNGVLDLTDRVNNWELREFFPANRWEGITRDGKIYGVPAFTFVDWMYYRVDWFEEAGLSVPTTLAEFREAAIALTDPSRGRFGFGMRGGGGGQGFIIDMLESFGSPILDADGNPAIDRDLAIEALTFWTGLYTRDGVVPPSAPEDSYRQIMEGFRTGQTAMIWHHTGSLREVSDALEPGVQFMTAVKPAGPAAHISRMSYLYNGLMSDANADASWAWVSFWGENEPAIAFLEETGYFPASEAIATDERITGNPVYQAALDATRIGRLPPSFIGYPAWSTQVVLPAFQKVLVGDYSVEEAVDEMIIGLEDALR
ncbi:MAG: sugar ABC transporter substrate-binding protein [Phototrophicales bacterium]|nr:MAG: sugar ABC transporter substrate-binding protein [Phototrophicales bacterium]